MNELSDEERLLLVDRVDELQLNDAQKSILSDKAMNCQRGDADFVKLKALGTFWRRHREGLVSYANFCRQVDKACGLPQQQPQQQQQQQISAGEEEEGEEQEDDADTVKELHFDDNHDDQENAHGNGANNNNNNNNNDDEDDDGGDGGGEHEHEHDSEESDSDAETKQFVTLHTQFRGFLSRHLWRTDTANFEFPGEGYWEDEYDIKEFRDSTARDLKVAKQAVFPTRIPNNPLSQKAPKARFDSLRRGYHLCRKVAVSRNDVVYRATDAEIEAALEEDESTPDGMTDAAKYIKVVRETRRRHRIAREAQGARAASRAAKRAAKPSKRLRSR